MWITSSLDTIVTPSAIALGNFDGIHRGHQQVIAPTVAHGQGVPTVVTFHPHPKEFFSGQPRTLLTPLSEKVVELQRLGIQQLVRLPFNQELARLSPEEFVESILIHQLKATYISIGLDFHFGKQRSGSAAHLQQVADRYQIPVQVTPLMRLDGDRISSSAIREALQQGDLSMANTLLGRPYPIFGTVIQGQQLGRTLGFPTANLKVPSEKFLPRFGVYAVRVAIGDVNASTMAGVMNIGVRPTVNGAGPTVEIHLFDWSGDLYGQTLCVFLEQFLRPEQKFDSLDALKSQIQTDCAIAQASLSSVVS